MSGNYEREFSTVYTSLIKYRSNLLSWLYLRGLRVPWKDADDNAPTFPLFILQPCETNRLVLRRIELNGSVIIKKTTTTTQFDIPLIKMHCLSREKQKWKRNEKNVGRCKSTWIVVNTTSNTRKIIPLLATRHRIDKSCYISQKFWHLKEIRFFMFYIK